MNVNKQLEKEIKEVKLLTRRERYCFRCGKDRLSIVGVGGSWFYNPLSKRSLCDTRDKDGYATCKSSLERGWCDECNKKLQTSDYYKDSLNSDYHWGCWKKYCRITELSKRYPGIELKPNVRK